MVKLKFIIKIYVVIAIITGYMIRSLLIKFFIKKDAAITKFMAIKRLFIDMTYLHLMVWINFNFILERIKFINFKDFFKE